MTPRVFFGLKLDSVSTTGIRDQLINRLRQTATTTQTPTDSSTEADLVASLVFCLLFGKESSWKLLRFRQAVSCSVVMISPPKKLVHSWKQKGLFRQSLSICVDTLLCGDGGHKEPWTFLSFFVILRCLQRWLAWVLDACRVWMTGLVVETLIYHWGFLVQQVMSLSKIGKDFMDET